MKLFKKIALAAVGATMAIGIGAGLSLNQNFNKSEAAAQLLNSFYFNDGGSSSNSAYAGTNLATNVSYASDNPGGTSGTTAWEADYANLSLTSGTRLGGKLVSTVQTDDSTAWANIKTKFTFGVTIEQVEVLGVTSFGTAGNWTNTYLQSSTDSVTWTTVATSTTKSGTITFSGLTIVANSYLRLGIALTASGTNSGMSFTGLKVYESLSGSVTLVDLVATGTPTTTTYQEGDPFDSTGVTVTAYYSDSSSEDVTSSVLWGTLLAGNTSVEGTYTFVGDTLSVVINGLTINAAPAVGGIVDGHAYLITAFKSTTADVQYVLKGGTAFASKESGSNTEVFTSAANYSLSDAFVFTKVGVNQYEVTSGVNYLSAISDNNGLVLGETTDSWTASVASGETGGGIPYDGVFLQDSTNSRYLTVYGATPNFRTYTGTTSQPLPAACIVLYDMTVLEGYASSFNEALGGVCNASGNTNVSSLASAWSTLATSFAGLSASQKAVYADTTNAVGNASGNVIQQAIAKYEYVAAKYNTQLMASGWDFMGRNITPASGSARIGGIVNGNNLAIIALVAVSTLGIIGGILYFRKRKLA